LVSNFCGTESPTNGRFHRLALAARDTLPPAEAFQDGRPLYLQSRNLPASARSDEISKAAVRRALSPLVATQWQNDCCSKVRTGAAGGFRPSDKMVLGRHALVAPLPSPAITFEDLLVSCLCDQCACRRLVDA
jgi:hypothetical protein